MGNRIEFLTTPTQGHPPRELVLDSDKSAIMSKEIEVLLAKNAVARASEGTSGFTSTLFLVPKADST